MKELERVIKARALPAKPVVIEANAEERAALSARFDLASIEGMHASITLEPDGAAIRAQGKLRADFHQICAVSAEEFAVSVDEDLAFRFVLQGSAAASNAEDKEVLPETGVEIELSDEDCDEIEFSGDAFDLGEAVAQSLGLAIDPYAEGPQADAARKAAGIVAEGELEGPLADMLKGLVKD